MIPALKRKEELNDWFGNFDQLFGQSVKLRDAFPKVDIYEDQNNVYIEADLPGIDQKNVSVKIDDNVLTLSGFREDLKEEKKKGYYRVERQVGNFERHFRLNENIDYSKADAKYDKGILTITFPKKEESKPKLIDIKIN